MIKSKLTKLSCLQIRQWLHQRTFILVVFFLSILSVHNIVVNGEGMLDVVFTEDDEPNNRTCYPIPRPGEAAYDSIGWPDQSTYICADKIDKTGAEALKLSDMPADGSVTIDGKTWAFLMEHTGVPQRVDGSIAEKYAALTILHKMVAYFRSEVLGRPEYKAIRGECLNSDELCAFWASVGECESNRIFMVSFLCPKM